MPVSEVGQMSGDVPRIVLPDKPKPVIRDPGKYLTLVYGREKIGKTTFFASYPDALFFFTEPGGKGLPVYSLNNKDSVEDWSEIKAGVKALQLSKRFSTVVIDTVDRAYDLCLDWVCKQLGIPHPGEDRQGRQDFGKSWRAVKQEFLGEIYKIIKTGRGVGFTSHSVEREDRTQSGITFTRIQPSMGAQARSVIEALVDFFFYAEYLRDREGSVRRVLITEGDELIWAGHRKVAGVGGLPRYLPLKEEGGWQVLQDAFNGKERGIDPREVFPATGSEAVQKFTAKVASTTSGKKITKKKGRK